MFSFDFFGYDLGSARFRISKKPLLLIQPAVRIQVQSAWRDPHNIQKGRNKIEAVQPVIAALPTLFQARRASHPRPAPIENLNTSLSIPT